MCTQQITESRIDSFSSTSQQDNENTSYQIRVLSNSLELNVIRTEVETEFSGKVKNDILMELFSSQVPVSILNLAITAINNRTRERNFARLTGQLSMGIISEEEFDKEIKDNAEKYVVKCNIKPSPIEISNALKLSKEIIDVDDTNDFSVLYSFDESQINSVLVK